MKENIKNDLLKIIGNRKAIILAGHFPIITSNTGDTFPGIYQDIKKESEMYSYTKKHPYMGKFPLETFKMGVSLLKNKESKILLLVNDHQFMKKMKEPGNKVNPYREDFYLKNHVPISYELELALKKKCPSETIWTPSPGITFHDSSWFVSEQLLRNRFSDRKKYRSCSLKSNCAQEFYPLLEEVSKTDFEVIVNFIPFSCTEPITDSTNLFKRNYNDKLDIINIFLNGTFSKKKMWENAVIDIIKK